MWCVSREASDTGTSEDADICAQNAPTHLSVAVATLRLDVRHDGQVAQVDLDPLVRRRVDEAERAPRSSVLVGSYPENEGTKTVTFA